jgi:hypothetical protein
MVETLKTVLGTLLLLFQSRSRLQVEILALRQQLIVLRRTAPKRVRLGALDRLLFVLLYRLWPGVLDSIAVIQPDTIVRWHRHGFRALWRWKSRRRLGRPGTAKDIRDLIREISRTNPLWGAPRAHGELLKLGITAPRRATRNQDAMAAAMIYPEGEHGPPPFTFRPRGPSMRRRQYASLRSRHTTASESNVTVARPVPAIR